MKFILQENKEEFEFKSDKKILILDLIELHLFFLFFSLFL